jgi:hypothetical protein
LALLGVGELFITDKLYLRVRVWLERYAALMVAAIVAAALLWLASELILLKLPEAGRSIARLWGALAVRQYPAGIRYYAPGIALYEFLIALAGVAGTIIIIALRGWSRMALFSLLWAAMSFGYFLASRECDSERLLLMLLPAALVAAIGIDNLHHTRAWRYARVLLLALGVATIYIQATADLVYVAPDAGEAPWTRHANLYWRDGATPLQARDHLREIRRQFPANGGTVFNVGGWEPALRWYLREFRPASAARLADLVINPNPPLTTGEVSEFENSYLIDLEESWQPALATLTLPRLVRFLLTAAAWGTVKHSSIGIIARPRSDLAPTMIEPPPSR